MKIKKKAVFLDAGGTLFDPFPSIGEIYVSIAKKYGFDLNCCEVEKRFSQEFKARDSIRSLHSFSNEQIEVAWWKELVSAVIGVSPVDESFNNYFEELFEFFSQAQAWIVYPEVVGVLKTLKQHNCKIIMISNWDSRLLRLSRNLGLDTWFDHIVASAVVGVAKPSVGIFNHALEIAGVNSSEVVHVGDSVENDFEGASNAGIDCFLIDRSGSIRKKNPHLKQVCIDSLSDLLNII